MASTLPFPIPAPPRTPTPPPDDQPPGEHMAGLGLEGFSNSPAQSVFDPHSLSPMDENFPGRRYGSIASTGGFSSNPLSPVDTNSLYSPMSIDSAGSQGSALMENGKGAFNFQPTVLAKSPVTKSVRLVLDVPRKRRKADHNAAIRALASGEVTNTSIAASLIKSSSSHLPEPHSRSPIPFLFPPSKNASEACPASKTPVFGGASATWLSQPILSGALKALWH